MKTKKRLKKELKKLKKDIDKKNIEKELRCVLAIGFSPSIDWPY